MTSAVKGKVVIYACGGAGINVGSKFEAHRNKAEAGFALLDIVYIDTSRSNLRDDLPETSLYLLEGLDGSGKLRAENYGAISERVRDILQTHRPGDLNIILSSGAGGSGSVIAPSLASELLKREIPVVVLTIGAADTRLDAENTLKTLKSYEGVAKTHGFPIVMGYVQNGNGVTRAEADKTVGVYINALLRLFSRENRELDSKDLFNWLRSDRVTTFKNPGVNHLSIVFGNKDLQGLGNVISVATLVDADADPSLGTVAEYQCVGYMENSSKSAGTDPVHYLITDGVLVTVASQLSKFLKELEDTQAARIVKGGLLSNGDRPTDSGLVL